MKNHEIVRALPRLKDLKLDREIAQDQITRLQKQVEQLDREIRILDGVDTVIDGIAVHETDLKDSKRSYTIYGQCYNIGAVGADIRRGAEVYPNAHTSEGGIAKDWGIKLYSFDDGAGPQRNEDWLNTGWALKDAIEVARRWVVHGEKPHKERQSMLRERHALDPEGRATKRRRDAYEAAWLAGHKDLAKEILLGRAKVGAAKPPKGETANA